MSNLKRKRFLLILAALSGIIVCSALIIIYAQNKLIPFDTSQWNLAKNNFDWPVRSGMARDLINRKILLGKGHSEIVEMLGDPENYTDARPNEMVYLIREDYGFLSIDPKRRDHLIITLDSNGRAENVEIKVLAK